MTSDELISDAAYDYVEYIHKAGGTEFDDLEQDEAANEQDLQQFVAFLSEGQREDVLTVTEDDWEKKRYKAYGQWLKGKSLFKQSKVDPEYKTNA